MANLSTSRLMSASIRVKIYVAQRLHPRETTLKSKDIVNIANTIMAISYGNYM